MTRAAKDGSLLLSELADAACLRSNLFSGVINGREAVKCAIEALDRQCPVQKLIYRHSVGNREFILTEIRLASGNLAQITTVGVRDECGWIGAIMQDCSPPAAALELSETVATGLS